MFKKTVCIEFGTTDWRRRQGCAAGSNWPCRSTDGDLGPLPRHNEWRCISLGCMLHTPLFVAYIPPCCSFFVSSKTVNTSSPLTIDNPHLLEWCFRCFCRDRHYVLFAAGSFAFPSTLAWTTRPIEQSLSAFGWLGVCADRPHLRASRLQLSWLILRECGVFERDLRLV